MINLIINIVYYIKTILKIGFNNVGAFSIVKKPLKITNAKCIKLGEHVYIHDYGWLFANQNEEKGHSLFINDKTIIGHYCHIVAISEVVIEKSVLLADKVFISDCNHNYENTNVAIVDQGLSFIKPVHIGEGSWIGENVCVCGASIGKHCVIGANSVVTRDIPDYCVAVGSPAKIVKKYDFELKKWVEV